jgi:hypothetical protein
MALDRPLLWSWREGVLSFLPMAFLLGGCGGGSVSAPANPVTPPAAAAVNIQGQWQVVAHSTANANNSVLIEANFTQTGSNAVAVKPSVVLIQGMPGAYTALGGECDKGALGNDSIQGTISGQTLSFTLTEAGPLGTGTSTGTATISADGTQITTGTYGTPAVCSFAADSGSIVGAAVKPFAGTFAGMLANGSASDAVTMTVSQTNYDLSVAGTDNGTPFTLAGTVVGATFDVKGMIAGRSVEYIGIYEPSANDFRVYDTAFHFLGAVNFQTSPPAPSPISVSVSPATVSVAVGQQTSFTATVANDSANKGVAWMLSGAGCSGASCGILSKAMSASGAAVVYTAPASLPSGAFTLTATSVADATKSGAATITITAPPIIVSVSPQTVNLATGGVTQTFTATLQNDVQNQGVAWTLSGATCSGVTCGTVSPASSASGAAVTYTSPAKASDAGTVTLTATSLANAAVSATATITLAAPPAPTATAPKVLGNASVSGGFGVPVIATDHAGNIDEAWVNPDGVHFVRSTDGGNTFTSVLIPSPLGFNTQNDYLQIALDASGNINLLWSRVVDASGTATAFDFSRSTDSGATFSKPVDVTQSGQAQMIVRPDGKIVVTWIDQTTFDVMAVSSADGVTFSSPVTVWTSTTNAMDLAVAGGPQGQIYILWTKMLTMTNCSILLSASQDAATYSTPTPISGNAGSCNQTPSVTVDDSGNVDVAWDADGAMLFFSRSTNSGVTLSAPVSIPTGASPNSQQIGIGPDGTIYVLWLTAQSARFASSVDSGATFSATPALLPLSTLTGPAVFGVDACSNITVVGQGANVNIVFQRSIDGGVTFSDPVKISDFSFDYEEQLVVDKSGNVHITWAVDGPPDIEYVRLPSTCSIP